MSRYGLSCPSSASSVTTTVPGGRPIPPQVPILAAGVSLVSVSVSPHLMKTGSRTPAWYMSLMTSCRRMPAEGIPIPWEMESTGPTLYIAYLHTTLVTISRSSLSHASDV